MTMHNELYPKSNVVCLNIPRKDGGRGLQGVEERANLPNVRLQNYVKESRECLLNATRSVDIDLIEPIQQTKIEAKKQKKKERKISWEGKILHDQFIRQTKEVGNQDRWQWFRNGTLKRETESFIDAAQEQVIRTNLIKEKIKKSQGQMKCRMCSRANETIKQL